MTEPTPTTHPSGEASAAVAPKADSAPQWLALVAARTEQDAHLAEQLFEAYGITRGHHQKLVERLLVHRMTVALDRSDSRVFDCQKFSCAFVSLIPRLKSKGPGQTRFEGIRFEVHVIGHDESGRLVAFGSRSNAMDYDMLSKVHLRQDEGGDRGVWQGVLAKVDDQRVLGARMLYNTVERHTGKGARPLELREAIAPDFGGNVVESLCELIADRVPGSDERRLLASSLERRADSDFLEAAEEFKRHLDSDRLSCFPFLTLPVNEYNWIGPPASANYLERLQIATWYPAVAYAIANCGTTVEPPRADQPIDRWIESAYEISPEHADRIAHIQPQDTTSPSAVDMLLQMAGQTRGAGLPKDTIEASAALRVIQAAIPTAQEVLLGDVKLMERSLSRVFPLGPLAQQMSDPDFSWTALEDQIEDFGMEVGDFMRYAGRMITDAARLNSKLSVFSDSLESGALVYDAPWQSFMKAVKAQFHPQHGRLVDSAEAGLSFTRALNRNWRQHTDPADEIPPEMREPEVVTRFPGYWRPRRPS